MKTVAVVLFTLTLGVLASASELGTYSITLTVTGLEPRTGTVRAALYASKEDYMRDALATQSAEVGTSEEVKLVFDHLAPGDYALTLYYDENDNGKLDTGLFKIPKEKVAFSNNAWRRFGPAKWKDARFELIESDLDLNIQMKRIRKKKQD